MTIYVDDARIQANVGNRETGRTITSAWYHLISDQLGPTELHEFATKALGLRRSSFQPGELLGRPDQHDPAGDHYGRLRSLLTRWATEETLPVRAWSSAALGSSDDTGQPFSWPLPHVWLGVSVEDQKHAARRIPALLETPATVRFISAEPLLGPVDLRSWLDGESTGRPGVSWVIAGGESGPGARPCDPEWIRSLLTQCQALGVPVFVKQMGSVWARAHSADSKGGNPDYWPGDLRVREFPIAAQAAL